MRLPIEVVFVPVNGVFFGGKISCASSWDFYCFACLVRRNSYFEYISSPVFTIYPL